MGLTAHVIDDNWNLLDLTLSCVISEMHTADGIFEQLDFDKEKFGIEDECVSALVTDTAAVMNLLGDNV